MQTSALGAAISAPLASSAGPGSFRVSAGVLTVNGSHLSDNIRLWETGNGLLRAAIVSSQGRNDFTVEQSEINSVRLNGFDGNDRIVNLTSLNATVRGGDGSDRIIGGNGSDRIWGDNGNDVILGNGSNDVIRGGNGQDRMFGGAGNDQMFGDASQDWLNGQAGNDQLRGGGHHDTLYGGDGVDRLSGDSGNDTLIGQNGNDILMGGNHNDRLFGGNHHDRLLGGNGQDYLVGNAGNDYLAGSQGNDRLLGSNGHDRLLGGSGTDQLRGGDGRDGLLSVTSSDALFGGRGEDRFLVLGQARLGDRKANDVFFRFRNQGYHTVNLSGEATTFRPGSFTLAELSWVDQALKVVQDNSYRSVLLQTASGSDITIYRHGDATGSGNSWLGWNLGSTQLHLTSVAFQSLDWLHQTVIHELAHNWDDPSENVTIGSFRALSGWYLDNGTWRHAVGATNFTRNYGRGRPEEDFATSFAAYFFQFTNLNYGGLPANYRGVGAVAAPDKMAYMRSFVNSPLS